jgi:hypothetical protein
MSTVSVGPDKPGFATTLAQQSASRGAPQAGVVRGDGQALCKQDAGSFAIIILIRFMKYQLIYKTTNVYRYAM